MLDYFDVSLLIKKKFYLKRSLLICTVVDGDIVFLRKSGTHCSVRSRCTMSVLRTNCDGENASRAPDGK